MEYMQNLPVGLNLTPYEQAARLAVLAGGEEVLYQKARSAIYTGDPRWACSLADHLLVLAPDRLDYHLLHDDALQAIGAMVLSGLWQRYEPPVGAFSVPAKPFDQSEKRIASAQNGEVRRQGQ